MEIPHSHLIDGTIDTNYHNLTNESAILAQSIREITEVDVIGNMEDSWYNFVDSGQAWALLLGLLIGYIFKGLTSY